MAIGYVHTPGSSQCDAFMIQHSDEFKYDSIKLMWLLVLYRLAANEQTLNDFC